MQMNDLQNAIPTLSFSVLHLIIAGLNTVGVGTPKAKGKQP
jgi:hypothetical protein